MPRIMILGDSITYGWGVRRWQDCWPELLALALARAGTPHEMAVFATPGRDIPTPAVTASAGTPGFQEIAVPFQMPGARGRPVRFRFYSTGSAGFTVASLDLAVDHGLTVVDLTDALNTFNAHTSLFDAHPNERAHQVIAEKVFGAIRTLESAH